MEMERAVLAHLADPVLLDVPRHDAREGVAQRGCEHPGLLIVREVQAVHGLAVDLERLLEDLGDRQCPVEAV